MSSDFVFSAQNVPNLQHTKKPPDPSTPKLSFHDKLLGSSQKLPIREKHDMIEQKLVRIELENGNRLLPKVYLEPQIFQELCTPWKDALVVKLLGKNLGYTTMKERLHKVWKTQGGFEIMDNDNGFFMVKFDQTADKDKVISEGPWMIFDHCLAVSHWSPEFASPNAKVERTVVWVRFPGLNLVYYDESFLLAMASAIGRPIRVDTNTLKVERGRFARVCVEVDLTAPVVGKIWVNGHWYKIQYEGLHLICTNCGCYGHLARNCSHKPTNIHQAAANQGNHQPPVSGNQSSEHSMPTPSNGKNLMPNQNASPTVSENINSIDDEINEIHGDWMLVTRKKKSQVGPTHNSKHVTNKSNKFSPLSQLAHHVKPIQVTNKNIPKPKFSVAPRMNKERIETKRRRQEEEPIDSNINFTNIKSTADTINDQHHANTLVIGQTLNPSTSHVSATKTKDVVSYQVNPPATLPYSQAQPSKNIPQHDGNNISVIPQSETSQSGDIQETVYAEDDMQVPDKNIDSQADCHDNIDNPNSSKQDDEDMVT